jgi:conjugative transfer signal peptidase TraF
MSAHVDRRRLALLAALGIVALAWPSVQTPVAHLVYNPSDSMSRGWYRIEPSDAPRVGDVVLVRLPSEAAALAARRGYLSNGIPLLKRVGAMTSQRVCVEKHVVRIDGKAVANTRKVDGQGRPLPVWSHCRRLRQGELFLLSTTSPASFDSRYFGPVSASDVIGVAQPLWTWEER